MSTDSGKAYMKKKNHSIIVITAAAMVAAIVCVATMIVKIPSPMKGYINLGDCAVLLAGAMFSPLYGFLAAGLGSALADLFYGYVIYAPVTFIIKGAMALIMSLVCRRVASWKYKHIAVVVTAIIAELLMIGGYFAFEGILYGFPSAALNIPANAVQGTAGIILGCILIEICERTGISFNK